MQSKNPFQYRRFEKEIILLNVRWYLRYPLSYRNLEEMMLDRGLKVDHTTIYRWVQCYSPEIEKRSRCHMMKSNDSWRTDETYIKVKGVWKYLYRAVDSNGNTIDFLLRAKRDQIAAKRFFQKALKAPHTVTPRVITVDKNAAYPPAIQQLKDDDVMADACEVRQVKYLNNIVEQDHRFIKRLVRPGLGFKSFHTAWRTLRGFEAMNMIRKGQVESIEKGDIKRQVKFIEDLFPVAA
jgi:IS6 family transposase